MIKRGEADVIDIPVSQGTEIRGLPMKTIRVPNSLSAHLFFTGMYDDKAAKGYDPDLPWRKVGVREALNIAINRPAILNRIFNKEGTPAPVAFPMPGLGYDNSWKLYDYDPARAKKLLADNGYPNGFDITLYSLPRPGLPDFPLLVEAVADDWSKLGLRVKIVNTQWGTIRGQQRNKALTGGVVALTFGPVNPDGMRGNIAAPFYYFAISPELNAAEEAIKTAKTDKELIDASLKLGTIERDVSAFVPLYFFNSLYVVDPKKVASWDVRAHFGAPDAFGTITKP
jgi:ABC-type transport system substrate-binding protein